METIDKKSWTNNQSWNHKNIFEVDGQMFKVRARLDIYVDNSYAIVKRFDGAHWNEVVADRANACPFSGMSFRHEDVEVLMGIHINTLILNALKICKVKWGSHPLQKGVK